MFRNLPFDCYWSYRLRLSVTLLHRYGFPHYCNCTVSAIYGGVIAVVIVAIILCRSRHIKLGAMMDLVVMGLLIGQAIGRWGNFLNREAFGAETTLPWRMQLTTTAGELVDSPRRMIFFMISSIPRPLSPGDLVC